MELNTPLRPTSSLPSIDKVKFSMSNPQESICIEVLNWLLTHVVYVIPNIE